MVEWIDSDAALARVVERFGALTRVAVDTEADSFHHYKEKLCLIQLSGEDAHGVVSDVLVDPLADLDLSPLRRLLEAKECAKVFHDVAYDLLVLRRDLGVTPQPVFDTMLALRFLGVKQFGLASVLKERFGFEADKTLQRSDWSRRPLSAAQLAYAASDTRYLVPLARLLEEDLAKAGRLGWFMEECARLPKRATLATKSEEDRFWAVKGIKKLRGEELAVGFGLFRVREDRAKQLDRPVFRVFPNETLIEIARTRPTSTQQLAAMRGVGPSLMRSLGERILEICDAPPADAPSQPAHERLPPAEHQARERRFEALREKRRLAAVELGLDPEVLVSNATLWELAIQRGQAALSHPDFAGWRGNVLKGQFGE